jgi:hypothetical protein
MMVWLRRVALGLYRRLRKLPPPDKGAPWSRLQEHVRPSALELLARENARSLRDTQGWLHRRVEKISYTDRLMIKRRVSVDFTIPDELEPYATDHDGRDVYFVPVGLIRKWPPLMSWDLRDTAGEPLPLLTGKKNARVDAEALIGLAPSGPLRVCAEPMLAAIPESPEAEALVSMGNLIGLLSPHLAGFTVAELDAWRRAVWLAGAMVANSVVWARTVGSIGERHVVKFEFQQPVERELVLRRRLVSAFSWGAIRVFLNLPNLGERGSYHLELTPPPGLEIARIYPLSLSAFPPAGWKSPRPSRPVRLRVLRVPYTLLRQFVRAWVAKLGTAFGQGTKTGMVPAYQLRPSAGAPYYWNAREKAYLYMQSTSNQFGVARIDMSVSRGVLIRPALVAGVIIAAFLTVATARSSSLALDTGASVTLLLLVPGFLGFLAIRPGEHPLVSRHLVGVTFLVVVATALPAIAAFVLIAATHTHHGEVFVNGHTVHVWWRALSWCSWAVAFGLLLSWLFPVPERDETVRIG